MGKLSPVSAYLIAGGLLAAAFLVLRRDVASIASGAVDLAGEAFATVGAAINPVSDRNVFYSGASAVVQTATGDPGTSLGSWLFDKFNPGAADWVTAPTPARPRTYGQ